MSSNPKTKERPPVVVVMGHIDHGKTTILDWYRNTRVVQSESGGITQHIGAYSVVRDGKSVTFIDTPGHEAFSTLRARGARIADIAIVVIAADEGVKPQTKEALQVVQAQDLPFVIAFNKSDKPEANAERVKQELAKESVLVESYGGKIPSVEVSAKTGKDMENLLEVIMLLAELRQLTADPTQAAHGVVVEAHRDNRRGISATLLVADGTIRRGDFAVIGDSLENVKILEDHRGTAITEAGPSAPVLVAGLHVTPAAGDTFRAFSNRAEAERFAKTVKEERADASGTQTGGRAMPSERSDIPQFNIVLKADVVGSKEALEESLKKIGKGFVDLHILRSEVGDIGESDVKLSMATHQVTIVGFKVKMDAAVRILAQQANIRIIQGDVIYDVLNDVKKRMEDIIPSQVIRSPLGKARILKVFTQEGARKVVGGRVDEGILKRGAKVDIRRMKEVIGTGSITQLQHNKANTDMVEKGKEFGILIDTKTSPQEGDILEVFEEEVVKGVL